MKLIQVKTLHIINHECDTLRTVKVYTIFGITLLTKTEPAHNL